MINFKLNEMTIKKLDEMIIKEEWNKEIVTGFELWLYYSENTFFNMESYFRYMTIFVGCYKEGNDRLRAYVLSSIKVENGTEEISILFLYLDDNLIGVVHRNFNDVEYIKYEVSWLSRNLYCEFVDYIFSFLPVDIETRKSKKELKKCKINTIGLEECIPTALPILRANQISDKCKNIYYKNEIVSEIGSICNDKKIDTCLITTESKSHVNKGVFVHDLDFYANIRIENKNQN